MKKSNPYTEVQKFNNPILVAGLALVGFYLLSDFMNAFYQSDVPQKEFVESAVAISVFTLIACLVLIVKLKTQINEDGVSIRFYPFHSEFVIYKWSDIKSVSVVQYKPLKEYGGWGIRVGFKSAKAYSTRGNRGIKLNLKNGQQRLIGTQKEEEATKAISLFRPKN